MKNIAIILSGGVGERLKSNCPKQYIMVNNKPIIAYTLEKFVRRDDIAQFVVVADKKWHDFILEQLRIIEAKQAIFFACPGTTRQHSIYNALKVLKQENAKEEDVVIIHDAVRPQVTGEIIAQCIEGCKKYDGVLPVIAIKDTVYQSVNGKKITNLLPRQELYAGQAPESFRFGKYLEIHEKMNDDEIAKINGSTEIAFKKGLSILLAKGDEKNFKITTMKDLQFFETRIR
jgi:2-C-methyl-D-erythritol 4-phosphate cytidylyltransferase